MIIELEQNARIQVIAETSKIMIDQIIDNRISL